MNKLDIDAIIVVEGKTDINFLKDFLNPIDFIITNGSEISENTINAIKTLSEKYKIIILTDPDTPGKRIRTIINDNVSNCYNAFIDKNVSIKKNKVGVAESTKEEILKSLQNLHIFEKNNGKSIKKIEYKDLVEFGYNNIAQSEFRMYIAKKYSIDYVNTKNFIKRINQLNIPIEQEIKNYGK